jgi:hypothetical protein
VIYELVYMLFPAERSSQKHCGSLPQWLAQGYDISGIVGCSDDYHGADGSLDSFGSVLPGE